MKVWKVYYHIPKKSNKKGVEYIQIKNKEELEKQGKKQCLVIDSAQLQDKKIYTTTFHRKGDYKITGKGDFWASSREDLNKQGKKLNIVFDKVKQEQKSQKIKYKR